MSLYDPKACLESIRKSLLFIEQHHAASGEWAYHEACAMLETVAQLNMLTHKHPGDYRAVCAAFAAGGSTLPMPPSTGGGEPVPVPLKRAA